MKAAILAGGLGSRLRPWTYTIPKPLIPVGKKPILEIIIEQLRKAEFDEIILALGYGKELIEAYFGNGSNFGVRITYAKENKKLGTAGPLKLVEGMVNSSFLVMNGDILTKIDFKDLMNFHLKEKAEMTIGVRDYEVQIPYGVVKLNATKVQKIKEKPVAHSTIVAGIYVLDPSVLKIIPKDTFCEMPHIVQELLKQKKKVIPYYIKDYWQDLGNLKDLEDAKKAIKLWEEI